jgi:small-conductance mechanosensitive channel
MSMKNPLLQFEHRRQPLLSPGHFLRRLVYSSLWALLSLAIWLFLGMLGYHWLAGLSWTDAYLNAAMIVGGMGPVDLLTSPAAKLFAGLYAILSGVVFLGIFGLLIAPVFHRFLHRFHLDSEEKP